MKKDRNCGVPSYPVYTGMPTPMPVPMPVTTPIPTPVPTPTPVPMPMPMPMPNSIPMPGAMSGMPMQGSMPMPGAMSGMPTQGSMPMPGGMPGMPGSQMPNVGQGVNNLEQQLSVMNAKINNLENRVIRLESASNPSGSTTPNYSDSNYYMV